MMQLLKQKIYDFLKVKFLVSKDSIRNWQIIVFVVLLFLIMIGSSHKADQKIMTINNLNKELLKLRAEYVDNRSKVVKLKLESTIREKVSEKGLHPLGHPPKKIKVITKED
ncbi:FtsL-like putative cell division protein [Aureivirga sp. CE67]|uniref:FtsL-like putative cell division protein n=1 Tax=Aureivirga sp. CE67 TaxID=1788983 RepID=UPI001E5F3141|nr:FtsL-like putative cell division protein [Aureivirga sp. CE67]